MVGRVINDMSSTGVGRVLKAVAHPLPTYIYKRSREILYREVEYIPIYRSSEVVLVPNESLITYVITIHWET